MKCYQKMMKKRVDGALPVTDDTMVVEEYGEIRVKVIEGSYTNIKITTPEDMRIGQEFLQKQAWKST
jgi:2-C-methyl-D-erythritol 4-phosphate cytidylyltransferase